MGIPQQDGIGCLFSDVSKVRNTCSVMPGASLGTTIIVEFKYATIQTDDAQMVVGMIPTSYTKG